MQRNNVCPLQFQRPSSLIRRMIASRKFAATTQEAIPLQKKAQHFPAFIALAALLNREFNSMTSFQRLEHSRKPLLTPILIRQDRNQRHQHGRRHDGPVLQQRRRQSVLPRLPLGEQLQARPPRLLPRLLQRLVARMLLREDLRQVVPRPVDPPLHDLRLLRVAGAAGVGLPQGSHPRRPRGRQRVVYRRGIAKERRVVAVPQSEEGEAHPREELLAASSFLPLLRPVRDRVAEVSKLPRADGRLSDAVRGADDDDEAGPPSLLELEEVVEVHAPRPTRGGGEEGEGGAVRDVLGGRFGVPGLGAVEDQDLLSRGGGGGGGGGLVGTGRHGCFDYICGMEWEWAAVGAAERGVGRRIGIGI
ncbi:hypothetical protein ACHAWF_011243, partial [Thalassiosira exigua]